MAPATATINTIGHNPDLMLFISVWVLFNLILIKDYVYPFIIDVYVKFQVYKKNGFYSSYMEYIKGASDQQPYKALRVGLIIIKTLTLIAITLLFIKLY